MNLHEFSVHEATVEYASASAFGAVKFACLSGTALDAAGERSGANAAVLPKRLAAAVRGCNPALTPETVEQIVRTVQRPPQPPHRPAAFRSLSAPRRRLASRKSRSGAVFWPWPVAAWCGVVGGLSSHGRRLRSRKSTRRNGGEYARATARRIHDHSPAYDRHLCRCDPVWNWAAERG
jgi:hypothetical protein